MLDFLTDLFDTSGFPPRWQCGTWSSGHGWLHILSDLGVWSAYVAIPCVLAYFVLRKRDVPFRTIFWLFGAFILACGTTHLMEAIIFYWPAYRLAGAIKLGTALVSWATVIALIPVTPKALAMRSPEELEREIAARKQAEAAQRLANADLERRVEERTADLAAANAVLRSERERFRITLSSIGDGVITTDMAKRVTFLNPVAETLTGWSQAEVVGVALNSVFNIINEETRETVDSPATRVLQEGVVVGLANHTVLVAKNGAHIAIDDSGAPIRNEKGETTGVVLVFRDVTRRRQLEADQARLATIVSCSQDSIISSTLEGQVLTWNAGAERLFGYSSEEMIGQPISRIVPPERNDEEESNLDRLRRGEHIDHYDTIRIDKQGRRLDISMTLSPLRDSTGRIVGASKVGRDITDRKQSERALRQSREALQEADRRKDEFLATLSHELRNPLAPLRNGVQILKVAGNDEATIRETLDMMDRQLGQMVRLIDDLLDISRISQGKIPLHREIVEVSSVVANALEISRPLIDEAGHEVTVTLPAEPLCVNADPARLAQVFANLLNNAAKFTERGGQIHVRAERDKEAILVHIRDTGIGIPAEMLSRIFDKFTQGARTKKQAQGGLGLGLSVAKTLIEMHGGEVRPTSAGSDQGSEFTVRLPACDETRQQPARTHAFQGQRLKPRRILVVDDNVDSATSLAQVLKLMDHETCVAHDGLKAVQLAEQFQPEIIFMDIGMPNYNGLDATRRIREQSWGRDIVIVALTGWGQMIDKLRSEAAGCDSHLVKPVDPATLEQLLKSLQKTGQ